MKRVRVFLANVGHRTHVYPLVSPPLGIMALAAYVRTKFDMDILLVNQRLDNCTNADLVRRAVDFRADLVGFSSLSTAAYRLSDLTRQIRQALPNALILLGGPRPTGFSAEVMATCAADAVVIGEGEPALEQIIEAYLAREDFSRIPGLVWRDAEGNVIRNPGVTPMVADLDSLPRLAYDLIDMRRYWRKQSTAPIQWFLKTHPESHKSERISDPH
jgi:radical SAM superfamily enzyme YgiQ (UPF0313 family)